MLRTVNLKCSRHFYPRGSDGNEGSEEHVGPDGPVTDSTCGQYHHDNHPDWPLLGVEIIRASAGAHL